MLRTLSASAAVEYLAHDNERRLQQGRTYTTGRDTAVQRNAHALRCTCDDYYQHSGTDFTSIK